MKHLVALLLFSVILLGGALTAAATDVGVAVSADYLFGTLESESAREVDLNGVVLQASFPVAGPFGISGTYVYLTAKDDKEFGDLDVTDGVVYATYSVPTEVALLTVLGGYGSATFDSTRRPHDDVVKGFRLGAYAATKPAEKVTLDGSVIVGIGNTWELDDNSWDAGLWQCRLNAAYEIVSGVSLEAGYNYAYAESSDDEDPREYTVSGFHVGVRAMY